MDKKPLSYKIGYAFGTICVGCVTSIIIALTIKLLTWLF
jgi:hypothetical protein